MIIDNRMAMVGTANMDLRSFDLNFEVNAIIYDTDFATELRECFLEDVKKAEKIDTTKWSKRPIHQKFFEKAANLFAPLL